MGKHEPFSPKDISNRIKAKGLQKLRWFCQMCQKQCRDENGFKCHTMSESHQRQLLLFADNPEEYIDSFSKEFLDDFMKLLKRRFGTRRVHANIVYQEHISDRLHTHMNSTKWETLTEFVKWLGREGLCKVDQTEKGWFVQYIDRDPETIALLEKHKSKEKMDMDDQEKAARFIEKQIQREAARKGDEPETVFTEMQRDNEEEKVAFTLPTSKKTEQPSTSSSSMLRTNVPKSTEEKKTSASKQEKQKSTESQKTDRKRKSALDEIMEMEEQKKEKVNRRDNWICKGIIVKVISKKLGERFYRKKAVIKEVKDQFVAVVEMLETGDMVKLDQAFLETVIPAIGKTVVIVNGAYRGSKATLLAVNEKSFSVNVEVKNGPHRGRVLEKVAYEDISKLDT